MLFIDTETTSLNPRLGDLIGIAFGSEEDQFKFRLGKQPKVVVDDLVGHNIKFDAKFLLASGYNLKGKLFDTLSLVQLVDENLKEYNLDYLVKTYIGSEALAARDASYKFMSERGIKNVAELSALAPENEEYLKVLSSRCKEDANNSFRLWQIFTEKLNEIHKKMQTLGYKKTTKDYYLEEIVPLEKVLTKMELTGVKVDIKRIHEFATKLREQEKEFLNKLDTICDSRIVNIENYLYDKAVSLRKSEKGKARVLRSNDEFGTAFNWKSNDHLGKLIYENFKQPSGNIPKTKTGKYDVGEHTLAELSRKVKPDSELAVFLKTFSEYKKTQKILTTYVGNSERGLLSHVEKDRIYPDFISGGGPVTGRLACRNPNIQNLPRQYSEIKRFFRPDDGEVFAYFDYSQIELRVAAHLSKDRILCQYYKEGKDLHALTAQKIFGKTDITKEERQVGKTINFATIYDASPWRLADIFEGRYDVDECGRFRLEFFKLYRDYAEYLERVKRSLVQRGHAITEFGRIRRLPELKTLDRNSKEWKHALKQGINFSIQSFAASLCKRAMVGLDNAGFKLVSQVHDSVVIGIPLTDLYKVGKIKEIAETVYSLRVPIVAEVKLLNSFDEEDVYEKETNTTK